MTVHEPAALPDGDDLRPRLISHLDRIRSLVVGQDRAARHLVAALLAGGHVLLEGAPGLGKTRLARLVCAAFEGRFRRIQFTPDLLPADLVGAPVLDSATGAFRFVPGPVFANFILADEINRAPARIQSALLEAMEERQVTTSDGTRALEAPFFVVATQNPIEHDGTWELPQAQLDRFLMRIDLGYPEEGAEARILALALDEEARALAGETEAPLAAVSKMALHAARQEVAAVHVSPPVRDYAVRLVAATRAGAGLFSGVGEHLSHPVSPRGTVMLVRAAQALAWLDARDHVLPGDVRAAAPDVLRHRLGLSYQAEAEGVTPDAVVAALLGQVDVV